MSQNNKCSHYSLSETTWTVYYICHNIPQYGMTVNIFFSQ